MAVTYPSVSLDQLKGPYQGAPASAPLHMARIPIQVLGTYATGGQNVDLSLAYSLLTGAITGSSSRGGVTSIQVLSATAAGDYYDGAFSCTPSTPTLTLTSGGAISQISAASTGNLCLVKFFTGVNGVGGAEIANGTALNGYFCLLITLNTTVGALGLV